MLKGWRFWTGIGVGVIVVVSVMTVSGVAMAQGPEPGTPLGQRAGFVDADGDGQRPGRGRGGAFGAWAGGHHGGCWR